MYIYNRNQKESIPFKDIRCGTVFENDGLAYLKGVADERDVAINLKNGHVIWPDGSEWNKCYIYPRASIKL